jgi:hypothetical protein
MGTGEQRSAPHGAITGSLDALPPLTQRPLPPAALHVEPTRVVALLPGGRYVFYPRDGLLRVLGQGVEERLARRWLAEALEATGSSHLELWPGARATFRADFREVTVERLRVTVRVDATSWTMPLPGFTHAAVARTCPGEQGKELDADGGVGPFVLDGATLWLGLTWTPSASVTGVGGVVRCDLASRTVDVLRPDVLASRPARAMVRSSEGLVVSAGTFIERRLATDGDVAWHAPDAVLVMRNTATEAWSSEAATAGPLALAVHASTLWIATDAGALGRPLSGGPAVLHGCAEDPARLVARAAASGTTATTTEARPAPPTPSPDLAAHRAAITAATDAEAVLAALDVLARHAEPGDAAALAVLGRRLTSKGFTPDTTRAARQALVRVLRSFGTAEACATWKKLARDLRSARDAEMAERECAEVAPAAVK